MMCYTCKHAHIAIHAFKAVGISASSKLGNEGYQVYLLLLDLQAQNLTEQQRAKVRLHRQDYNGGSY